MAEYDDARSVALNFVTEDNKERVKYQIDREKDIIIDQIQEDFSLAEKKDKAKEKQ